MNWLAHLRLAPNEPEVRIGALCGDFATAEEFSALPPRVQWGVAHHRAIDRYTDTHPVVARSKARIASARRRFAGVLVDVFYDHFLARHWHLHGDGSALRDFTAAHYRLLDTEAAWLPAALRLAVPHMRQHDWLASYATIEGIDDVLRRMDRRLRRPGPLADAAGELRGSYEALGADFAEFFPAVCAFAATATWALPPAHK